MNDDVFSRSFKSILAKHLREGDEHFLYQMQRHYLHLAPMHAAEFWLTGKPSLAQVIEHFVDCLARHGVTESYAEVLLRQGRPSDPAMEPMLAELRGALPTLAKESRGRALDKVLVPQALELETYVFSMLDYLDRHQHEFSVREMFPHLDTGSFNAVARHLAVEYLPSADGDTDTIEVSAYPGILQARSSNPKRRLCFALSSHPSRPQASFTYNPRGSLGPHYRVQIFSVRRGEMEISIETLEEEARHRIIVPVRFQLHPTHSPGLLP